MVRIVAICRITWQPREKFFAACGSNAAQFFDRRPRRFRIHMIGCHRRHAAPIVDAGID